MAFLYSLVVNGKQLGPFERRAVVGMRVKDVIDDNQLVYRSDGTELLVSQLMQDRLEVIRPNRLGLDSVQSSMLGPSSIGMWPQFSVRFGGGPTKPGVLGFNGSGAIIYQADALLVKGNRLNKNFGMSKGEVLLPLSGIASSSVEDVMLELWFKDGQDVLESLAKRAARIEFVTAHEAQEVWELLNMSGAQGSTASAFLQTTPASYMS